MAGAIYTDGRLGSHGVILCKPVGGGVIDIENVPNDQTQAYIDQGYYQCPGTGDDPTQTGYCIPHPAGNGQAAGYDCTPAPAGSQPPVAITHTTVGTPAATPITPTGKLPAVGSSDSLVLLLMLGASALVGIVAHRRAA